MSTLARAIEIARVAHAGQSDKAGAPYVGHPLRLMAAVAPEEAKIAAVLHDVVEDGPGWSLERLRREGFSDAVLRAVDALTKRPGEDYPEFILRAAADPIAKLVKRADLVDNMDVSRLPEITARDLQRLEKYSRALAVLDQIAGNDSGPDVSNRPSA